MLQSAPARDIARDFHGVLLVKMIALSGNHPKFLKW